MIKSIGAQATDPRAHADASALANSMFTRRMISSSVT